MQAAVRPHVCRVVRALLAVQVKGLALLVANKDDLRAGRGAEGDGNGGGGGAAAAAAGAKASGSRAAPLPLPLPLAAKETFAAVVRTSASQRMGLEVSAWGAVGGTRKTRETV